MRNAFYILGLLGGLMLAACGSTDQEEAPPGADVQATVDTGAADGAPAETDGAITADAAGALDTGGPTGPKPDAGGPPGPKPDAGGPPGPKPDAGGPPVPDGGAPSGGGLVHGFFAVHLDPGSNPGLPDGTPDPARPLAHLDELTHLVEAADVFDHKLTLMFTAHWASHMVSPLCELPSQDSQPPGTYAYGGAVHEDCLALIRAFESHGHEIAFHHHPEGAPNNWDGFSNDPAHQSDPDYLGTVSDALAYVNAIPAGGAESIVAGTTEEYPDGVHHLRVMSARGPTPYVSAEERGDLASTPCAWNEDDNDVWRFRMRAVSTDVEAELGLAHTQLATGDTAYTAGFITHAKDVDPLIKPYEDLFLKLNSLGITLEGLSAVAGHYTYTSGEPATDGDYGCPDDEALDGGGKDCGPPGPGGDGPPGP